MKKFLESSITNISSACAIRRTCQSTLESRARHMKQMNNIPLKTKLQKHFQTLRRHLQEASPERFLQALGFIPLS